MEAPDTERSTALVTRSGQAMGEHPPNRWAQLRGRLSWTLASAGQKWHLAAEHFLMAATLYDDLDCPYEAAQAREQAALAMWKAENGLAEESLRSAITTYEQLGADHDIARCMRIARSNGVRVPVPYRGGTKGYGEQLSPREEEVAHLAAAGYTNKEIGAKLFLSPATVDGHLGRAMRKLGVHSRAAVAARLLDLVSRSGAATQVGTDTADEAM